MFTLPFVPIYDAGNVKPLWKTNDTALVVALGNKQVYITNLQQLDLMGIEHAKRTLELKNLNKLDISKLPVQYFYLQKGHPSYADFVKRLTPYSTMLYENREVEVWGRNSNRKQSTVVSRQKAITENDGQFKPFVSLVWVWAGHLRLT